MSKMTPDQTLDPRFEDNGCTVPLGVAAHQQANRFLTFHRQPDLARQVYLNSLAVYAVNYYLQDCLEVEMDLQQSDSHHPVMQAVANVADLYLKGLGRVECRVVLPGETAVKVPMEVWDDRIAYIAVQVNPELTEATLVGFLPAISAEAVPLSEWQSLDNLLVHLDADVVSIAQHQSQLGADMPSAVQPENGTISGLVTHLNQWLQGQIDSVWKTVEGLREEFCTPPPQAAYGWRSPGYQASNPDDVNWVKRAKILDFPPAATHEPLAIVVGLQPIDDVSAQATDDTINIWVKICPLDSQAYLPPDLNVALLNDQGTAVMQFRTVPGKNVPRLRFKGKQGDRFSVKVELAQTSLTEMFLI